MTTSHFVDLPVALPARLAALNDLHLLDTVPEEAFDDIVHLATSLCEAPIALVSLVAGDRQWFKARVGFPECETDLNSSVCVHALAAPDLLVIPNLATDPRTANNPLVAGEPHIRFYAGAPLRTPEGHAIGSLCVIDHVPRPGGLTPRQEADLKALARQVMSQVELRRLLRSYDALAAEQRSTAASLRRQGEVLQTITDHVGQAVFQMNGYGVITFVNPAAEEMFGWSRHEMEGKDLHALLHHRRPDEQPIAEDECPLRQALKHGRLLRDCEQVFFHRDGRPIDVLVTNAPVDINGAVSGAVLTVSDVTERRRAEVRLSESEAYWRGLFKRMQEGIVIGEVVKENGSVVDWRYLEVNEAWESLSGVPAAQAIGRTVRELLPSVEDDWIAEPAHAVDSGETVTFTRQFGSLGRSYEGRISALDGETFIIFLLDVTERLRIEQVLAASNRRKTALARLGDHLRATKDEAAMSYTAAAIVGQTLAAAEVAYAVVDATCETMLIGSSWCAPGCNGISGAHSFRAFGSYVEQLAAGRTVAIADVATDERTRGQFAAFRALGIGAFINVPVIENDQLVAILLAHFAQPRALSRDEEDFARAAVDRTRAGIARVQAEERQALLNNEISHRLKNTLAIVQAIANQTLNKSSDRSAVAAFDQRLMALSTAHDVLLQKDWENADLGEVLRRVLDAAGAKDRYSAEGPMLTLGPRAALSTSLLLHELATNASKYGALTRAEGKIAIRWHVDRSGTADQVVLDWREAGGPPAVEPIRKGFGSRLLKMGLVGTGGSRVNYGGSGLSATFQAPRSQVEQA